MGVPTQGSGTTTPWTADGSGYDTGTYNLPNDGSQWSFSTVMVLLARIINSLGGLYTGASSQVASYTGAIWTITSGPLSTFLHALADKAGRVDANQTWSGTNTFTPTVTFTTGVSCGDVSTNTCEATTLAVSGTIKCGPGADLASGGTGCVAIHNRSAAPTGSPSGGGVLYVESGALKYLGSSGTVTTIASA